LTHGTDPADAAGPRPPAQRTDSPRTPAEPPTTSASRGHPDPPDLGALSLPELRTVRRDAQRDEADLSYLRRLLQGRIDILRAELARRGPASAVSAGEASAAPGAVAPAGATTCTSGAALTCAGAAPAPGAGRAAVACGAAAGPVVERLAEILTDAPARHRSSARHVTLGTPHSEEYRQLAAEMLAEVELSDLGARSDGELHDAMGRLVRYEQQVSRRRQRIQRTADDCSAEIARRYREGEAQVEDLLV
jgi:hypothetical protein